MCTELPPEIGKLGACSKLDLSHNMLTELPWELGGMEKTLNILELGHNPLVIPPRPGISAKSFL